MAEGVIDAGGEEVVDDGAGDVEPAPDPEQAPHGWTRDKVTKKWRPKKRPGRGGRLHLASPDEPVQQDAAADRDPSHDPDPGWLEYDEPKKPAFEASKEDKDEVAALLALLYSIPADFLLTADPYCFGELNQNLDQIISATVPIVCRSERVVRYITGASGLILWIKLGIALKPVAVAAFRHHVLHSVELVQDEETGRIVAMEQDYSVYSAA